MPGAGRLIGIFALLIVCAVAAVMMRPMVKEEFRVA
jgi:hypothetical protein